MLSAEANQWFPVICENVGQPSDLATRSRLGVVHTRSDLSSITCGVERQVGPLMPWSTGGTEWHYVIFGYTCQWAEFWSSSRNCTDCRNVFGKRLMIFQTFHELSLIFYENPRKICKLSSKCFQKCSHIFLVKNIAEIITAVPIAQQRFHTCLIPFLRICTISKDAKLNFKILLM